MPALVVLPLGPFLWYGVYMSIASPANADYTTTISTIRGHLAAGTQMSAYKMRLALAVVKDAISRFTTCNTAVAAQITALEDYDTEAEVTSATAAVVGPAVADVNVALAAAAISVPTYTSSTVADG